MKCLKEDGMIQGYRYIYMSRHKKRGTRKMIHFDTVGSFLRPDELKEARKSYEGNSITREQLTQVEDEAIKDLIKKQEAAGLHYITDGEFRRSFWHLDFMWGLGGVSQNHDIQDIEINGVKTRLGNVIVEGELTGSKHPFIDHYRFVKQHITPGHTVKLTIPSPAQFIQTIMYSPYQGAFEGIYPSHEEQVVGVGGAYLDFLEELYQEGARVIQFDDCSWGTLVGLEGNTNPLKDLFLEANNYVLAQLPKDFETKMHVCRGNYKSQHFSEGPYTHVANHLFNLQHIETYYLEYDDERSGGFEPLEYVTGNKCVVLGLVTSKNPELEDKQRIIERIKEAAQYVPLERLALSPQCGFASTEEGNALTEQQQWAKIAFIKEIVEEVWGE